MKAKIIGLLAVVLLAGPIGANAAGIIVGGMEWRQLTETVGLSWDVVAGECDPSTGICKPNYAEEDGTRACLGPYEGPCFGGWTWASNDDIQALFETLIRPESIQFPTATASYAADQEPDIEYAVSSGQLFRRTGWVPGIDVLIGWSRSGPATGSCRYAPFLESSAGIIDGELFQDRAVLGSCLDPSRGNDVVGVWFYRPVPEPGTLSMLGLGLIGLGLGRRRGAN